ncbi:MAG: SMR family transporter [Candidatus Omnitrophota bacterium]
MREIFLSWGMLLLSVLFNVSSIFVIKMKLDELGPIKVDSFSGFFGYIALLVKSWPVVAAIILFFLAPFIFAVALSRMDISVAYPVQIVVSLVLLALLAVAFLGESITPNKVVAMALAVVCVYLLRK